MNAEPGEKNHAFISISSEITFKLEKIIICSWGAEKNYTEFLFKPKEKNFFIFNLGNIFDICH